MHESNARWSTIVLTGAAGRLGSTLRPVLAKRCACLRSSDIAPIDERIENERIFAADLQSQEDVARLVEGADAIVHFGGIPEEDDFERILSTNIVGTHTVFEQARQAGVRRIVFASTNHVTGFHESYRELTPAATPLPDTLYAVSKCFGESLGALYAFKHGIEVACLRIGACWPAPRGDQRDLALWLSHGDLGRLVGACLDAEAFDFEILYGVSNNTRRWWTNTSTRIDYRPQDDSEAYAAYAEAPHDPNEIASFPALRYQGGAFAAQGLTRTGRREES